MSLQKVIIYTDGACSGNPGPGGWAAVLISGDYKKEISGGNKQTTNNKIYRIVINTFIVVSSISSLIQRQFDVFFGQFPLIVHNY